MRILDCSHIIIVISLLNRVSIIPVCYQIRTVLTLNSGKKKENCIARIQGRIARIQGRIARAKFQSKIDRNRGASAPLDPLWLHFIAIINQYDRLKTRLFGKETNPRAKLSFEGVKTENTSPL